MRILNVSALIDRARGGGTAERTARLSSAMHRSGCDVTVLATDAGIAASGELPSVGGAALNLLHCVNERMLLPGNATDQIERAVEAADIVHLCNHWTVLNLFAARAARRVGRPYVVCPAGALPVFGRSRLLKKAYNMMGGRRLVSRAKAWVAITRRERSDFVPYGVSPELVTVIPNGVDPGDFEPVDTAEWRARHRLDRAPLVLFVGRLNPIKGPDLLIQAFLAVSGKIPEHTLVIAGADEGELGHLRALARPLGERVRFVGFVAGRDKAAAYQAADLVVIPSRQEAMSLVALEAGACGTPVLMTDVCGFDEAGSAGAGIVSPDVSVLASGLLDMLSRGDLPVRGERLREMILREYTWDAAAARYASLFARILREQA